jgi:hypothetical protein
VVISTVFRSDSSVYRLRYSSWGSALSSAVTPRYIDSASLRGDQNYLPLGLLFILTALLFEVISSIVRSVYRNRYSSWRLLSTSESLCWLLDSCARRIPLPSACTDSLVSSLRYSSLSDSSSRMLDNVALWRYSTSSPLTSWDPFFWLLDSAPLNNAWYHVSILLTVLCWVRLQRNSSRRLLTSSHWRGCWILSCTAVPFYVLRPYPNWLSTELSIEDQSFCDT